MIAGYYFPEMHPNRNVDGSGPNCHGMECKIVGEAHYPENPGVCCKDKDYCGDSAGKASDIRALNFYTKMTWAYAKAPVSQVLLENVLMDGHPVMWNVQWTDGGAHVMVIGGTDGQGNFYVHDPMNKAGRGSWQTLRLSEILYYRPPWSNAVGSMLGAYVPSNYASR